MTAREIVAALLALIAPIAYVVIFMTSTGAPYQTTVGHAILLITLPVGFVLVWLIERRPPSQGQRSTPIWARLMLGGAAGLLLATALLIVNGLTVRSVQEVPGTSLGTSLESGAWAGHGVVLLDDGRTVSLMNAFCGVSGSRVTVSLAPGLLGLDRVLSCNLPSVRPPTS